MIYNGCSVLLGASLGDSMGSYCEFTCPNEDNHKVIWEKVNPVFGTAKGQLTDDSEMAISLALGIMESINQFGIYKSNSLKININFIAYYYLKWFLTDPFDIGNTTYKALNVKNWQDHLEKNYEMEYLISEMYNNSKLLNSDSLSNGFLMRHTPMTVFLYYYLQINQDNKELINFKNCVELKKYEDLFLFLFKFIESEIKITHYNPECCVAAVVYDFLIFSILTYKNDKNDYNKEDDVISFDRNYYLNLLQEFIETLLKSTDHKIRDLNKYLVKILDSLKNVLNMEIYEEESKNNELLKVGQKNIGYYMHAINLTFFIIKFLPEFAKNKEFGIYRNIINFICNKGGDTDTNSCIVGGVVGAILGAKLIEDNYIKDHLNFNPTDQKNKYKREFLYAPIILTFFGIKLYSILEKQRLINESYEEPKGAVSDYVSQIMIQNILEKDLDSELKNLGNHEGLNILQLISNLI